MAENKKSFLLYCDIIHTVEALENEEAGQLFKHLLRYVNDKNPCAESRVVSIAFEPIKQQLKRDLKKWELEKSDKSIAGRMGNLKRWNPDLYKQVVDNQLILEEAERIAEHRTSDKSIAPATKASHPIANIAVNDTVNVNVNETVKVKDIKPSAKFVFRKALIDYGFLEQLVNDWLLVRKTKRASNTETAFKSFVEQVEKSGRDKNKILELCVIKSWSGFKPEWWEEITQNPTKSTTEFKQHPGYTK